MLPPHLGHKNKNYFEVCCLLVLFHSAAFCCTQRKVKAGRWSELKLNEIAVDAFPLKEKSCPGDGFQLEEKFRNKSPFFPSIIDSDATHKVKWKISLMTTIKLTIISKPLSNNNHRFMNASKCSAVVFILQLESKNQENNLIDFLYD